MKALIRPHVCFTFHLASYLFGPPPAPPTTPVYTNCSALLTELVNWGRLPPPPSSGDINEEVALLLRELKRKKKVFRNPLGAMRLAK